MTVNRLLALPLAALLCSGRLAAQGLARDPEPPSKINIGEAPYPVAGPVVGGGTVALSDLKGQVVLIYLFTTQPGPGVAELRMLEANTWPKYRSKGLKIIGVVRDADALEVTRLIESMHIDFPLIADPKKDIYLHFAQRGHPRAYLVGKDGKVKLTSLGYTDDEVDRISAAIEHELNSP